MAVIRRAAAGPGGAPTGEELRIAVIASGADVAEDRDLVDRFCLPEVRRHCRGRNIAFSESLLVSGEETARELTASHVASVLDVLRRDRPIVVCLLGRDRGVAVPSRILRSRSLLTRHPWLENLSEEGLSLAEIAMLEGVLGNPLMSDRVIVSLRQPAARRARRAVEPLVRLAERLRNVGLSVVAGGDDRRALADRLCAELVGLVDRLLPDAPPPSPLEQARRAQEAFAASRRQAYVEVSGYRERLDAFADGESPAIVITGERGAGKSALVSNWTDRYRARVPGAFIIAQYAGATGSDSDHLAMLRQVMVEIRERYGLKDEVPSTPEEIVESVPIWLARVRRERLILVLDGLDQLTPLSQSLEWLPRHIPPHVRLIVSAGDGPVAERLRRRGWAELRLKPLTLSERRSVTKEFLGERSRMLTGDQLRRVTSESTSSNPLFLRIRLEELRAHGPAGRLNERIDSLLGAGDLDKLFERVLERVERTHGADLVREVMTLLWASRRGLGAADLELLVATESESLADLLGSLDFHLIARDGLLTFFHEGMRQAVTSRYDLSDGSNARDAHRRLARYFGSMPVSRRRATEEPWQHWKAGNRKKLRESICAIDMFMELSREETEYELLDYWKALGSIEEMARVYEESLAAYESLAVRPTPLALVLDRVGRYFYHAGLYDRAEALIRRAAELSQSELGASDPRAMEIAKHHLQVLLEMGSYNESAERCRAMIEQLGPGRGDAHPMMIDALTMLADALHYQARYAEAEETARRAVSACERVHGPEHPALAEALFNLAAIMRDRDEPSLAESLLLRVLAIDEKVHGGEHPTTAMTLSDLGYLYSQNGRFEEAEQFLRRALAIRERVLGVEHAHTAQSYHQLAVMLRKLERLDEARALFEKALAIFRHSFGPTHPNVGACMGNLAETLEAMDELDAAAEIAQGAVEAIEASLDEHHPMRAAVYARLGKIQERRGMLDEAERVMRICCQGLAVAYGEHHATTASHRVTLAGILARQAEVEDAAALLNEVVDAYRHNRASYHAVAVRALSLFARVELTRLNREAAEEMLDEAVLLVEAHSVSDSDALRELEAATSSVRHQTTNAAQSAAS